MARLFNNKEDFLIIEMDNWEARSLGFGVPEGCVCMSCNEIIPNNKIYYICVMNDTMCEDCLKEWLSKAVHYSEDTPIEIRNYKYYSNILSITD